MKKILAFLGIIFITFYSPTLTFAHLSGQPPFFLVNGQYSNLYPVPLTSLSNFPLPQDLAPGNYLVNQNLNFGFDIARLPAPPDVVKKTQFTWDFGDGSHGQGLTQTHTYKNQGSYILSINAFDGTTPAPQLIESVLINVLPNKDYRLPKAVIKINGKQSKDPLVDVLRFPLGQDLHFDANSSLAPSSSIVSYFWDFGDQKSSSQMVADHYYPGDLTQVFPVLRVKDANGFLADSFVEVENEKNATNSTAAGTTTLPAPQQSSGVVIFPFILGGIGLMLVTGMLASKKRRRVSRK